MKRLLFTVLIIILATAVRSTSQLSVNELEQTKNRNFYDISKTYSHIYQPLIDSGLKGWKHFKRWEYFWSTRIGSDGKFPQPVNLYNEYKNFDKKNKKDRIQSSKYPWTLLGPVGTPPKSYSDRSQGIGRINIVRLHPTNKNILWTGSALGGLWKSTDAGTTWAEIPYTQFLSLGISDIAFSLSTPNTMYVATGDDDGSYGSEGYYSIGIIKTTDGGATWSTTGFIKEMNESVIISRLIVHPTKPNTVIASTSEGIFKSTDGGDTWGKKTDVSFYFRDMEYNPSNPSVMYASTFSWGGGTYIYRSDDEGESWTKVYSFTNCVRIELAVTRDDPKYVYALSSNSSSRGFQSFLASKDQGLTWEVRSSIDSTPNILGWYEGTGGDNKKGQGMYDLALTVSDNDKNEIYTGGVNIWKSTDGGYNWTRSTHWQKGNKYAFVHADHHELVYSRSYKQVFSAHDGGIDRSDDGGKTWKSLNGNLSIMQFYRFGCSEIDPSFIIAGAQDNGTSMITNKSWYHIYAGDGFESCIDSKDTSRCYCSLYYGSIFRSTNHGRNFTKTIISEGITKEDAPWLTPYVLAPSDPSCIYVGMKNIWASKDYGDNFAKKSDFISSSTIKAIAVSHTDKNVLYTTSGQGVWYTRNGGDDWQMLEPPASNISYIAVDPEDDRRIWITESNFNEGYKVCYYDGSNWTNISGNLPNFPVNCIAYQKDSPDRIYVGTDIGVFCSVNNSGYWEYFSDGLPKTVVNELEINYKTSKIRAATYGRGVWEAPLNMCNPRIPTVAVNGKTQFCQGDSVVLSAEEGYNSYLWSNGDTTRSVTVREEGIYSVMVDDGDCKISSKGIEIIVDHVPANRISVSGINPMCSSESLNLKASFGFDSYKWSNGSSTRDITVNEPGLYYVVGTENNGCPSYSDTVEVIVYPPPDKPVIVKSGNTLISSKSQFYQWFVDGDSIPGATNQVLDSIDKGNYQVLVTVGSSCTAMSDPFTIVSVEDESGICPVTITPNPAGNSFTMRITIDHPCNISWKLVDVTGSVLTASSEKTSEKLYLKQVDLSGYAVGSYYLVMTIDGRTNTYKIFKN